MDWLQFHNILLIIQHGISFVGVFIILAGVLAALCQFIYYIVSGKINNQGELINKIRLTLARVLILGLEFIVAADLIGTTTTPDYYSVGLLGIIVLIRTILTFSINREIMSISKES